jgi:8-oxo-dGTP diphosphatase
MYDIHMDMIFEYDPLNVGSKGVVWIGDKLLLYRRDGNTTQFPFTIDLPGGGPEGKETPFETYQREVREEFGLELTPEDIVAGRMYPSIERPGRTSYFLAAQLPAEAEGYFEETGVPV